MSAADNIAVAFLRVADFAYALPAKHVQSIVESPAADLPHVDLYRRLYLPQAPATVAARWALKLNGYASLLWIGSQVQIEAVPAQQLESLPPFLAGLAERACLAGWVNHAGSLRYLLNLQVVMEGAA